MSDKSLELSIGRGAGKDKYERAFIRHARVEGLVREQIVVRHFPKVRTAEFQSLENQFAGLEVMQQTALEQLRQGSFALSRKTRSKVGRCEHDESLDRAETHRFGLPLQNLGQIVMQPVAHDWPA